MSEDDGGKTAAQTSDEGVEKTATPWFLYFIVFLLASLAILIALYCVALNDPDFPSKKHRGPNLAGNDQPALNSSIVLLKPETGARAIHQDIPFHFHRPPPAPKPSKLHPKFDNNSDSQSLASNLLPPQENLHEDQQIVFRKPPSNFERVSNVLRSIATQNIFGLSNALLPKQSQQSQHHQSTGARKPMIDDGNMIVAGGPYVNRVDWGEQEWVIEGTNFSPKSQVLFSLDVQHLAGDCLFHSSTVLKCKPIADASFKKVASIMIMNEDSQSCQTVVPYYISFGPPGLPKRWVIDKQDFIVRVGLYTDGVPELYPSLPVQIWFEILQENNTSSPTFTPNSQNSQSSQRSRDSNDNGGRSNVSSDGRKMVIGEEWQALSDGYATFDAKEIGGGLWGLKPNGSHAAKVVFRASAVQTNPNTQFRKIIAPIIESFPIIISDGPATSSTTI